MSYYFSLLSCLCLLLTCRISLCLCLRPISFTSLSWPWNPTSPYHFCVPSSQSSWWSNPGRLDISILAVNGWFHFWVRRVDINVIEKRKYFKHSLWPKNSVNHSVVSPCETAGPVVLYILPGQGILCVRNFNLTRIPVLCFLGEVIFFPCLFLSLCVILVE